MNEDLPIDSYKKSRESVFLWLKRVLNSNYCYPFLKSIIDFYLFKKNEIGEYSLNMNEEFVPIIKKEITKTKEQQEYQNPYKDI